MYVNNSESYNSAEPGEKVAAVPGPCGCSFSNLRCSCAAHHCSFLMYLKIIIAYIYIYLHMYISVWLVSWTWGYLLPGLTCLTANASEIHCQLLYMGDFLLVIHHVIHSLSSGRGTPLAPVQNPSCAEELHAGRGVVHVPMHCRGVMHVPMCCRTARLLVFCLLKNLRISSYLCTKEDEKDVLGSNTNSRELGQSNII